METHSSILAWRIPWMEALGGLHPMRLQRVGHKGVTITHTHIHTVKDFSIVNEAEVDVILEFPCFLHDPTNVGNLISGSSAFSKSSL